MSDNHDDLYIAIVGMAGKFPGAADIKAFWELLKNSEEAITFFSDEALQEAGVDPALIRDPNYIKSRCIIEDEDKFDAYFFDISPREAEVLDPQQRLFLETCWHALEDAGYDANRFDGLIGLFGGVSLNTYLYSYIMSQKGFISSAEGYQLSIGNDKDFLTTRVSYKMNLKGPSVDVQTACSTSLVAVHMACQNLLNYTCDMALAGGVSITIPQKQGYYYQEGMILSKDGHCRAFDEKASGTISGSGSGIVVLKRLDEALADGDHIYGVIKGSAFNNDGSNRVGYTAPSVDGQSEAIANAQAVANIDPDTISYIEAHGTGTVLGDPIEITALSQVFREQTDKKQFCAIGSVKTNIGHLDAAAGVAGLIKTALALKHKQLPPNSNFEKPNPKIDFENSPFFVNDKLREWQSDNGPRRAGVSSFGIGGTNVHAVLEEAPEIPPSDPARPRQLLLLSAKSQSALDKVTNNLATYLKENNNANLADVAFTLQVGRKPLTQRRMLVCSSAADARQALEKRDPKRVFSSSHAKEPVNPPVAFLFSGQGAQYVNMGKNLYEYESVFREAVDNCCEILQAYPDIDLRQIIYPAAEDTESAKEKINQTGLTQPALFVIEYALAQLWMSWGIEPKAMIGHSIGEYVAACLAGVFSLEEALKLVAARGSLMQKMPFGAMLSLPLDEHDVKPLLPEDVSVAALNGKELTVVSGANEAIEALERELTEKNIKFRRLHTSHAFHSAMMDPILEEFTEVVKGITLNEPQIPYLSNLSGSWITVEEATDPEYYARHLRNAVRFSDNVEKVLEESEMVLLETGPGTTLSTLARRHPANTLGRIILSSLPHPQEAQDDLAFILNTIGRLWLAGVQIDWHNYYGDERRLRLSLPKYPFEKKRFWLESKGGAAQAVPAAGGEISKSSEISNWFYLPSWKQRNLPDNIRPDAENNSVWVIFKDNTGLGRNVAIEAKNYAERIIIVTAGASFQEEKEDYYALDPLNADHYRQLFEKLRDEDIQPDYVLHMWSIGTVHMEQSFEDEPLLSFKSLLNLTKVLGSMHFSKQIQLGIVTTHLFEITGFEPFKAGQSVLLGLSKVIPQEFPNIICRIIDVKLPQSIHEDIGDISTKVALEFAGNRPDLIVAFRERHRWVQEFEATPFERGDDGKGYLKKNGVYMITGGLGRIGLTLAGFLGKDFRARLALIDMFDFPEKADWADWLSKHDAADPISKKIKHLQEIEAGGAEILILKSDISDPGNLKATVKNVTEKYEVINGVIHAAGMVGANAFRSITEMEEDDYITQFSAKIDGTQNLAMALQSMNPDFVLLQSSMAAVLGGLGFGAYAAANAYLDAAACQQNRQKQTQWISVNWDGWQFDETDAPQGGPGTETAQLSILPEEGVEAFRRIFNHKGFSQILVSSGDLQARIAKWVKLDNLHEDADDAEQEAGAVHDRPDLPTAFVEPETELQKQIAAVWQKLLGIKTIGIYDDFFDLGGNSLMGTQLIAQLRDRFQAELPLRSLFDDPTISGVAKIIEEQQSEEKGKTAETMSDLLDQLDNLSDEEAARMLEEKKKKNK